MADGINIKFISFFSPRDSAGSHNIVNIRGVSNIFQPFSGGKSADVFYSDKEILQRFYAF